MKRFIMIFVFLIVSLLLTAYPVYYKEQYYNLYHIHYNQYPDDTIENIYYLEQAQKANFCNPLYALAKIENPKQWERYRYLFSMHINLKLIEQHLRLGSKYDRQRAYFFNAPWKKENLESLKIAKQCYETALVYWKETVDFANKAQSIKWIYLEEIQMWEDEALRIQEGTLDYNRIITEELARLFKVQTDFEKMDTSTY